MCVCVCVCVCVFGCAALSHSLCQKISEYAQMLHKGETNPENITDSVRKIRSINFMDKYCY